jgi:putative salt-induced outer membrane protein YdiY
MIRDTTHAVTRLSAAAALLVVAAAVAAPAAAQDGFSWENATELSFVSTGGNASSSTLGLKSALTATSDPHSFKLELGGIRGEITTTTRTATGTVDNFTVSESETSQLTAESYFARGRYDRAFNSAYVFAGLGWDRNTFAGIQNRYAGVIGLGRTWADGETGRFKTDIGATYTIQKDVDPAPGAEDGFGGVRLSADATRRISAAVSYASTLMVDENLQDTEDLRADWTNSIAVALTDALAFKTSLQALFDNQPALIGVPLSGAPPGTTVLTPGDKVDTVLTVALVITL